jgi:hypothetical protein
MELGYVVANITIIAGGKNCRTGESGEQPRHARCRDRCLIEDRADTALEIQEVGGHLDLNLSKSFGIVLNNHSAIEFRIRRRRSFTDLCGAGDRDQDGMF